MTKYLEDGPFGTGANSKEYRDNYDRIFRKTDVCALRETTCPTDDPCPLHGCTAADCFCPPPEAP